MTATYDVTCIDPDSKESQTVQVDAVSEKDAAARVAGPRRSIVSVRPRPNPKLEVPDQRSERPAITSMLDAANAKEQIRRIRKGVTAGIWTFAVQALLVAVLLVPAVVWAAVEVLSRLDVARQTAPISDKSSSIGSRSTNNPGPSAGTKPLDPKPKLNHARKIDRKYDKFRNVTTFVLHLEPKGPNLNMEMHFEWDGDVREVPKLKANEGSWYSPPIFLLLETHGVPRDGRLIFLADENRIAPNGNGTLYTLSYQDLDNILYAKRVEARLDDEEFIPFPDSDDLELARKFRDMIHY